jgi:hypothetical protein
MVQGIASCFLRASPSVDGGTVLCSVAYLSDGALVISSYAATLNAKMLSAIGWC